MRQNRERTLQRFFRESFLLSFLIPLFVIGGSFLVLAMRIETGRVKDHTEVLTSNISRIISIYLQRGHEFLYSMEPIISHSEQLQDEYISKVIHHEGFTRVFDYVYLLDSTGMVTWARRIDETSNSTIPSFTFSGITYRNKEFYKRASITKQPSWSETYTSLISGERTVTILIPYEHGYIAGDVDMRRLISVVKSLKISRSISFTILDKYGNYIYHPNENNLYRYSEIPQMVAAMKSEEVLKPFTYTEEQTLFYGSASKIEESEWLIIVSLEYIDAMSGVVRIGLLLLLLFIAMLILAYVSSRKMSKTMLTSLNSIASRAQSVARGKYESADPIRTGVVEFDSLATSVRTMSEAVQSREREITDANLAVEEQLQFQQLLIDAISMPIFVIDQSDTIVLTNKACEIELGSDPDVLQQFTHIDETDVQFANGSTHSVIVRKALFTRNDGTENTVVMITDITERLDLEARMNHSQRLQAIGKLAGGIAHDVNNQLAGIMGFAEIIKEELPDNDPLRSYIDMIIDAVSQSSGITRQLLAFARQGKYSLKSVPVNEVITAVGTMLRHTISRQISLEIQENDQNPHIEADRSQLQNAILNLGINARDAIGDASGSIAITASCIENREHRELHNSSMEPGDYVLISVCDTGSGMPATIIEHIFDPFFTTKPEGKGTGMGLAAVFGTVTTHNGCIDVNSTPGEGTCFELYFPLISDIDKAKTTPMPSTITQSGHGTLLLVDDEHIILTSTAKLLERRGFIIVTARNGKEAVDLFEKEKERIDCVILDANMPVMNGYEAFKEIRNIKPYIPIIIATGYADESKIQHLMNQEKCDYIHKPFNMNNLLEQITALIHR